MATAVNKSGNNDIDGILHGYKWSPNSAGLYNLKYSFPTNQSVYFAESNGTYDNIQAFKTLASSWRIAFTSAMEQVSNFTNLTFTRAPDIDATLHFAEAEGADFGANSSFHLIAGGGGAEGCWPEDAFNGSPPSIPVNAQGDVWVTPAQTANDAFKGTGYWWLAFHEFGHALGLKHGMNSETVHGVAFPALPSDHDSSEYSVMTYKAYVGEANTSQGNKDAFTTYMQNDIAALQYYYGANYNFRNDDTTYKFNTSTGQLYVNDVSQGITPENSHIFMTIWDGGGNDTYDFSNYITNITADLRPGKWINLRTQLADFGGGNLARGNIANALTDPNNPNEVASLIENVTGGSGSDTLIGNKKDNILRGGDGNDSLDGQQGSDAIWGDDGNDTLFGQDDNDFLRGGKGDDLLDGGNGVDRASYVDASAGVTVSLSVANYQAVGGGLGSDKLIAIENLIGGAFADTLIGNEGSNVLEGGDENDLLYGYGGNDSLYGGDGNDLLRGGAGNDYIDGGNGEDKISFALATGAITVSLLIEQSQAIGGGEGSDKIVNVEAVIGSRFNDTITGNESANTIEGNDGNDIIFGRGGADYILGGVGNDLIRGGSGNDHIDGGQGTDRASYIDATSGVTVNLTITTSQNVGGGLGSDTITNVEDLLGSGFDDDLTGSDAANVIDGDVGNDVILALSGNDIIYGRAGNDRIRGGAGNDFIDGGEGIDRASFYDATSGITVDLRQSGYQNVGGGLGSDILLNIENILGGLFDDLISGNSTANQLEGDNGDDSIFGLGGNDRLYGGNGNDLLRGDSGDDFIDGGADTDRVSFFDATSGISVDLTRADAQAIGGGLGSDTLVNIEIIFGGRFNDVITGNVFSNSLYGEEGNDTIRGGGGNDFLVGGSGADRLEGGEGNDKFVFGSTDSGLNLFDRITDFAVGQDKISLETIDANTSRVGDQSFTFIGEQSFSANTPGQLRFAQGFLYGNWNNDTIADFKIQVDTAGVITSSDFFL